MKVAVSSEGEKLESKVSKIFGRAPYFIIANVENGAIKSWNVVKNTNTERLGNVGVMSAQKIVEENVEVLLTGNVGPRASQVLEQFKVKTINSSGIVKKVLEDFAKKV